MTDNNQKEEQDIDFGSSMTDLMTSLMVIFILLLVLSFNHMENQGEKLRDEIVSELETSLKESGSSLKIEKDKDPTIIKIIGDEITGIKFESNEYKITEESKPKLKEVYDHIFNDICSDKHIGDIDSIQIIGYTDKNPVRKDPKYGNLSLSQDRALEVLKFGLQYLGMDSKKGKYLLKLASINGRGMEEQKKTNEESRRVEFRIRVKQGYTDGK